MPAVGLYSEATKRYSLHMRVDATCKGLGELDEVDSLAFALFSFSSLLSSKYMSETLVAFSYRLY